MRKKEKKNWQCTRSVRTNGSSSLESIPNPTVFSKRSCNCRERDSRKNKRKKASKQDAHKCPKMLFALQIVQRYVFFTLFHIFIISFIINSKVNYTWFKLVPRKASCVECYIHATNIRLLYNRTITTETYKYIYIYISIPPPP
jgi:hypothetical protein